mmetsp:Transcript_22635/g.34818  ORF Transcript_22635/g.34818 Transcript_22635/m.34818 type:complete len:313 (-) Transcript_22635:161-1099(-)
MDHLCYTGGKLGNADQISKTCLELLAQLVVPGVVLLNTLLKSLHLRTNDSSGNSRHTKRVVGDLSGQIGKDLRSRDSQVLGSKSLVSSSVNGALGRHLSIIGKEESTLSTVDHLVRLTGDGRGLTLVSSVLSLPVNSERVSAILKKGDAVLLADISNAIHISNLSTHVRDEAEFAVRVGGKLGLEVIRAHDVIVVGFNINGLSSGVLNCRRHSTESEGVGHDLITRLESSSLHHKHNGRTAGVEGNAVLMSSVINNLLFAEGDNRLVGRWHVVAVHSTRSHEFHSLFDSLLRNSIGCLDVTVDEGTLDVGGG